MRMQDRRRKGCDGKAIKCFYCSLDAAKKLHFSRNFNDRTTVDEKYETKTFVNTFKNWQKIKTTELFFATTKTGSKCSLGFLPQVRILLDVAVDQFLNLDGVDVAVLAVTNLESNNCDQPMFKIKSDDWCWPIDSWGNLMGLYQIAGGSTGHRCSL